MKRNLMNVLTASVAAIANMTAGYAQAGDTAQEVLKAAHQWEQAVATSDRALLTRLAHGDLIIVSADGIVLHALASVPGSGGPAALDKDDFRVKVYSDEAAVVITTRPSRKSDDRVLSLWVKSGRAWKIAVEQSARIGGTAPVRPGRLSSDSAVASYDPSSDSGEEAAAVLKVELRFRTLANRRLPLEQIMPLFTDEYLGITREGIVETREELFARSTKGRTGRGSNPLPLAQPYRDVRTKVYGNTAVLTAEVVNGGENLRLLRILVKRAEEWKIANTVPTQIATSR